MQLTVADKDSTPPSPPVFCGEVPPRKRLIDSLFVLASAAADWKSQRNAREEVLLASHEVVGGKMLANHSAAAMVANGVAQKCRIYRKLKRNLFI